MPALRRPRGRSTAAALLLTSAFSGPHALIRIRRSLTGPSANFQANGAGAPTWRPPRRPEAPYAGTDADQRGGRHRGRPQSLKAGRSVRTSSRGPTFRGCHVLDGIPVTRTSTGACSWPTATIRCSRHGRLRWDSSRRASPHHGWHDRGTGQERAGQLFILSNNTRWPTATTPSSATPPSSLVPSTAAPAADQVGRSSRPAHRFLRQREQTFTGPWRFHRGGDRLRDPAG